MRRILAIVLILTLMLCPGMGEEEEEASYHEAPPRPVLTVTAPAAAQSWESGGKLTAKARCPGAEEITAVLKTDTGTQDALIVQGEEMNDAFCLDKPSCGGHVTITARVMGQEVTQEIPILSPREKLFRDMFDLAYKNSKDAYYKHAPAQEDYDRGVCKNFVMRLFDTFKEDYRMAEYPELGLHMPKNKSKKDSAPYDYGIEWRPETAEEGSPFYIAAQFKYDKALSKEENLALCRAVLHEVKRGDFFQMVGDYYYGNGPHSLLFMSDWDEETDLVHWTDSNMKGDRVDGARWGYLQYDAVKEAEWFVSCITMKNRGCTIYRLRDDLYIK